MYNYIWCKWDCALKNCYEVDVWTLFCQFLPHTFDSLSFGFDYYLQKCWWAFSKINVPSPPPHRKALMWGLGPVRKLIFRVKGRASIHHANFAVKVFGERVLPWRHAVFLDLFLIVVTLIERRGGRAVPAVTAPVAAISIVFFLLFDALLLGCSLDL